MLKDARGLLTAATQSHAIEAFERAVVAFQTYQGDPLAPLEEATAADPGWAGAHIAKALILMTFFERRFARDATVALSAARPLLAGAPERERDLWAAADRLARGDWHGGTAALDRVLVDHPRDAIALQTAHVMDFFRGDALNLRNRVARVLPHWSAGVPGFAYVLGMHAFGLEECNQYPEAEATGRRALELAGDDSWAIHAVTHVMEMQGRVDEGIAWLEERRPAWGAPGNGFAFHNAWHLALFHLDREDHRAALALYDEWLAGAGAMAISRVDATALLWRLMLEGVDVGARAGAIAQAWEGDLDAEGGFYAFNDFHAALALAQAGRTQGLERLMAVVHRAASAQDANGEMERQVGLGACKAAIAFCDGHPRVAADLLAGIRDGASRFGGSHAQRDLLTLTLVEAATRGGQGRLAAHYLAERLVQRPGNRWGLRLLERARHAVPHAGGATASRQLVSA
ncbi:MAG TPA: tetratricopeptide repeat protein [Usitatibacteraceae bacterium]|nr:tetratricopeptide repeat protein [Usitatibacteraceae bacterium]